MATNTFFSVDAENGENTNENLWTVKQPKMPAHLAERSANLREKFYSYDKEQRNKQAFENRENNLKAIQGKAKQFIAKAEAVKTRKAQILGENNQTTFTQDGSPFKMRGNLAEKASQDVVDHQKSTSPVNVASNLEAKFASFETNRTEQMNEKVSFAARDMAKVDGVKKRKAQLQAQQLLTQGFANEGDTKGEQSQGWGSPMKLPTRLAARAEALQQRFKYSPTNMQQKAEANRKAFLNGIRAKAHKVSERREVVFARKAAMTQENAGMYTVFAQDENDSVVPNAGWNQRAKLPANLRKRYHTLRRKFAYDPAQRVANAEKNREAQLMDVRIKARDFSSKAQQARDRKALKEGNEFTFSFSADPDNNDAEQGWGVQNVKLPKALKMRCENLQQQFKKEPFAVRDAEAKARREQFYSEISAKARTFSGAPMGVNAYSISFNKKDDDFVETQTGWTDSQIVMPTALKARCNKLNAQFKPKPHAERQQVADTNRAQFMAERVAKGRAVSFKVDSAKAKRGMMQAAGFFNVNATDANDNNSNAGWGVRTRLPKRLAQRNNKLQQQFKKAPYAEREAEANARREMFYDTVANTARSTRSKGLGNKNMYSVVPADEEEFKMKQANGWGKAVMMPKRLKERVAFLNAKFNNRQPYEVRRQQAFYNRQAFNEHTKQFANLNAMKAVNAAERRSEFEDNMVIFSNAQPVAMPTKLAERANFLQAKFKKKNTYEERRFNASMNRGKFNLEKSKMAASFSNRTNTVQAQKEAFAVNMSLINVNGPVDSPVKMPKRLQKRVVDLHEKFSYDPFKRAQHVEANRQSRLAMIRAKAARQKTRAAAAAARRAQGAGTVVEESNEVSTNDVKLETVKSQSVAKTNNSGENVCSKVRKKTCNIQ